MFTWAKCSELKEMIAEGLPGAEFDHWLEGWMVAQIARTIRREAPARVCHISAGSGLKSRVLDWAPEQVDVLHGQLDGMSDHGREFPAVIFVDYGRSESLQTIDANNPFKLLDQLNSAASLVAPGGVLIWSHLFRFAETPETLGTVLEPSAIFQSFILRGFQVLDDSWTGLGKIEIYHDPDTLFVHHQAILEEANEMQRITRFVCGARRPSHYT